jgi:ABC-type multidrug transport system ATPase subunit
VRFHQVWFRYARRAVWTLTAVDAVVHPGETVVVLGRNGAGKSTLLQLAAGVLRPVRGSVQDRPQVIGWVPERFPADQPFTAGDYLHRMAELRGRTHADADADAWIERLLLTDHTGTRLSDLSKGTAQKVGLAQALLARPSLLILDEPWEGLDAVARTLIPEIVAEVTAAGGMALISDHRGEIENLPGAVHWSVSDATLEPAPPPSPAPAPSPPDDVIIEVAASRAEADQAVVRLRAAGHRVLGVRDAVSRDERGEAR